MQYAKEHEDSKNQDIIHTHKKTNNNLLVSKLKDIKLCNLPDKEFKINVLRTQTKTHTQKDNLTKSGKLYMNKMRNLIKR